VYKRVAMSNVAAPNAPTLSQVSSERGSVSVTEEGPLFPWAQNRLCWPARQVKIFRNLEAASEIGEGPAA
jgi:hypothetical protein